MGASVFNKQGRLWIQDLSGRTPKVELRSPGKSLLVTDWSPDGQYVVASVQQNATRFDVVAIPVDARRPVIPLVQTIADEANGTVSPDGKWLAYNSKESDREEVYVTTFPVPEGKRQISYEGGDSPRWSADGKALFFRSGRKSCQRRDRQRVSSILPSSFRLRSNAARPFGLAPPSTSRQTGGFSFPRRPEIRSQILCTWSFTGGSSSVNRVGGYSDAPAVDAAFRVSFRDATFESLHLFSARTLTDRWLCNRAETGPIRYGKTLHRDCSEGPGHDPHGRLRSSSLE
ncbi:MAG TPA: hypothetical protein VNM92_00750 [Thermoanaerobaculia bacterium]|nr:hypothetical protein [Thermoanaerobaculia bacterium]